MLIIVTTAVLVLGTRFLFPRGKKKSSSAQNGLLRPRDLAALSELIEGIENKSRLYNEQVAHLTGWLEAARATPLRTYGTPTPLSALPRARKRTASPSGYCRDPLDALGQTFVTKGEPQSIRKHYKPPLAGLLKRIRFEKDRIVQIGQNFGYPTPPPVDNPQEKQEQISNLG